MLFLVFTPDYFICTSGLPQSTVALLQRERVQNAAAWRVFELSVTDYVTPRLLQLHWLSLASMLKLRYIMHSDFCGKKSSLHA